MARKVTVNLYMTLDGYGEFPAYPGSDFIPKDPDAQFKEMWVDRYPEVDTVVMGRRSFEGHLAVHSEKARKPEDPWYLFEYSRWLDRVQKVCLSHTLKETNWQNSRIMSGDLTEIVNRLRAEPGKGIIIEGGPTLSHEAIQRGLADDYRMVVSPVILGRGNHYWGTMANQQTMKLLSVKSLPYGELVLHYEAVR